MPLSSHQGPPTYVQGSFPSSLNYINMNFTFAKTYYIFVNSKYVLTEIFESRTSHPQPPPYIKEIPRLASVSFTSDTLPITLYRVFWFSVQDRLATKKVCWKQGGGEVAGWSPLRLEWTQFSLFHLWCPPIKQRKAFPGIQRFKCQGKENINLCRNPFWSRERFSQKWETWSKLKGGRERVGGWYSLWKSNQIKSLHTMLSECFSWAELNKRWNGRILWKDSHSQ